MLLRYCQYPRESGFSDYIFAIEGNCCNPVKFPICGFRLIYKFQNLLRPKNAFSSIDLCVSFVVFESFRLEVGGMSLMTHSFWMPGRLPTNLYKNLKNLTRIDQITASWIIYWFDPLFGPGLRFGIFQRYACCSTSNWAWMINFRIKLFINWCYW